MSTPTNSVYATTFVADGGTFDKKAFGEDLKKRLSTSTRDTFVIDRQDWIYWRNSQADQAVRETRADAADHKLVSRAALSLLLDYCENENEWPGMTIVEYAAGIFHSRTAAPEETLFDVLPDVRTRLDASRLGLGHIYGDGT